MTTESLEELRPWETIEELIENGNGQGLEDFVGSLPPNEVLRAIVRLDKDDQHKVLTMISPSEAADLIEEMPDEHAADLIEDLPASDAAAIISEMKSDDQADVLGEMDDDDAEAILDVMEPEDAEEVRQLSEYSENSAGGIMMTEIFEFQEHVTAGDVIEAMGKLVEEDEDYFSHYIYVVSAWQRLVGVLPSSDLMSARRSSAVGDIMMPSLFVYPEASLDSLKSFFDSHDFLGVPVVDHHGRLIGVVSRRSVGIALADRAESERLKMQGIIGGDEIRTMSILTRSRRRLSWLSLNIVLNMIAASVIAFHIDTVQAVIALAVFLPIISDMSGCSGNQAVAVSMRELALGITKPFEVFRVWVQEISVGTINGLILGLLVAVVAWLWKGNIYIGIVVGSALTLNTMLSVSIGGTVPLILKRIGIDPAVASGPILTTVTDMCGFFLTLTFATILMSKLVG